MMKRSDYFETEPYYMNCFDVIVKSNKSIKEKHFLVNQIIDHHLWRCEEAVKIGFHLWKTKEIDNILEALAFHKDNCIIQCKVCKLEQEWREKYERKRPELC